VKIHLIAVGSELLTPFFRDTDSLYLTGRLNDLGLDVAAKIIVGDEIDNLRSAVRTSLAEADLVFVTGGLGPTGDDRTREAAAAVLGRPLILREDIVRTIEKRFLRLGRPMPSSNRKQAEVIEGAAVLANPAGTAPGQWVEIGKKTLVLLPGPPSELQAIFEAEVWPRLSSRRRACLARLVLKTTGKTESEVEDLIKDLYPKEEDRRLTILASPGQIELHLTASAADSPAQASAPLTALALELKKRLGPAIFSEDGADLEEVVGRRLRERKETIAVAESCTGGLLSRRLTRVPGSSATFREGFVTYSNPSKRKRLGVPAETLETYGAVSAETAAAMAEGVRRTARTDYGLAVTGIAGPSGGTADKPVGTVYTALSDEMKTSVERVVFLGDRERVQIQSTQKALDMLRLRLREKEDG